ncbi:hypothetical protein ACOALA_18700 [Alicyclobacillus acidoterrestris]|uniref:hypothetical protein n=1 Tax=Alicyclobacillus acidoterrestris TaxID=1450 RepID=UPI003F53C77C
MNGLPPNIGFHLALGMMFGFVALHLAFVVILYLLFATAQYCMFRKATVPLPWFSYIPVANLYPFFRTTRVTMWNWLWLLAPVVGGIAILLWHWVGVAVCAIALILYLIAAIRWHARLFKAFGMNPLWLLGLIGLLVPYLSSLVWIGFVVLYCIIGFHSGIRYRPYFDWEGGGPPSDKDPPAV